MQDRFKPEELHQVHDDEIIALVASLLYQENESETVKHTDILNEVKSDWWNHRRA